MSEFNKLLLIDDEPDILRVLSMSLRADGYDVVTAENGSAGLTAFEKEDPDIVITDIKMPGMGGIEVLGKIKEREPDAEVIIITGHGDIDNAIEALKFGASDYINKPIRDEALSIALQRATEKLEIKRQLKEYTINLEKKVADATREIRRRSEFQGKLIRSSNDGIVATDKELNIVIYNPEAEKIFGYSQSEVMENMRATDLYTAEMGDTLQEAMAGRNQTKDYPWREMVIKSKSGEKIPVRFSGTILEEKGRKMGSVAFFQDLREIKRLDIGQTVAGLAHGIKNILHGLKGGSYLVDLGIKKNNTEKLKTGWDMIKRNIGRTSNLVMDLLSYSKEREPEYEPCSPNEIANDVCELLAERAKENKIEIVKVFDASIKEISMDPRTIHEVLLNLMSNAIDACLFDEDTSKSWRIRLKTTHQDGKRIRFEVEDNGAGMNAEVQQKLFTSFFSTKGHRGTGLGLMVTRKLIEEHHGTIEVKSQVNKGTTFSMQLPYKEPDAAQ
jgi:PAS domain S-box-containing protein